MLSFVIVRNGMGERKYGEVVVVVCFHVVLFFVFFFLVFWGRGRLKMFT